MLVALLMGVPSGLAQAQESQKWYDSIRSRIPEDFEFENPNSSPLYGYWRGVKQDDLLGKKIVHLIVADDGRAVMFAQFGTGASASFVRLTGRLSPSANGSKVEGELYRLKAMLVARTDSFVKRDNDATEDFVQTANDRITSIYDNGSPNVVLRRYKVRH